MSFKPTSRNALLVLACCGLILGACAAYEAGEAPAPAAPEPPPPPELTEEQKIVARHVEAIGGEDAIRAHASMTIKGAFEMPAMGLSGEATIYLAAPDKGLVNIEIPGFGSNVQGFNGEFGWSEDPMQGARLLEGGELSTLRNQTRIHGDLEYDELYSQQTAVGETEWNGQAAYQIDLVDVEGNESSRYFAVETGLLIGEEGTTTSEMGTIETSSTLTDYKEFGGVLFATSTTTSIPSFGVEMTQTIESVTFDDVDPTVFEPSDAIKALLPE
ncbi:MAG: hypothetical protein OXP74_17205 [Acidobacteriota bacterium]|nr:hypothetical protein [Acidobacteriota bacterium]